MTDPIADMLTRIRNGLAARHDTVAIPSSLLKVELARILKEEGYINDFKVDDDKVKPVLTVTLKYAHSGERVISSLKRVSRPGYRVFVGSREVPKVLGGLGINILSTSGGVMTGKDARQKGYGGEVLCEVF